MSTGRRMEFLLTEYVDVEKKAREGDDKPENKRVAQASIPLMQEIVVGMEKTPYEKFVVYCPKFYPLLVSMIQYSDEEVRTVLSLIFNSKIKQMLFK